VRMNDRDARVNFADDKRTKNECRSADLSTSTTNTIEACLGAASGPIYFIVFQP
jgi:hypothetical protein